VEAAVDAHVLADAFVVFFLRVVPAGGKFVERDLVGGVAVDLVGAHEDEHRVAEGGVAGQAGGLKEVERADGVDVEIVEGALGGEVVGRLRGGVDDQVGLGVFDEALHRGAVADVGLDVGEVFRFALEALEVPGGVALGSEKVGPHVVVDADDAVAAAVEVGDGFGADQSTGACDEDGLHGSV
jgi:hypothetical protein